MPTTQTPGAWLWHAQPPAPPLWVSGWDLPHPVPQLGWVCISAHVLGHVSCAGECANRLPRTTRCCLVVLPVSKTSVLPPGRHPACLWDHWTQGGETVKWCWEFKLIFFKEGDDIDVLRGKKASCLQLHNNVERMVKKRQILIIGGTRKRCVTFSLWFPPIFCQFEIVSEWKVTK